MIAVIYWIALVAILFYLAWSFGSVDNHKD